MDAPRIELPPQAADPGVDAAGQELFADIDLHFAGLMEKLGARAGQGVREAAALVSRFTRLGHTCVDLAPFAGTALPGGIVCPPLEDWLAALSSSGVAGGPGEYRPMVLDGAARLYLWRYWKYQQTLAEALHAMARRELDFDAALVKRELPAFFPPRAGQTGIDWQQVAVLVALKGGLSIITGGPGTGKTTVIARILALLGAGGRGLKTALAAPTGKAAQRMEEAVRKTASELEAAGREPIPDLRANTIHRLLGILPGHAHARFSRTNPLPHDVVVVDEASMISLGLMARLVLALKPSARLILVGDRNQLSSVEPGHVMGDICGSMSEPRYSPRTCGIVRAVTGFELPQGSPTGVADSLVELTHAHRFRPDSGIRYLAEAVRAGDGEACAAFVGSGGSPDVLVRPFEGPEGFDRDLERSVLDGYAPYLEDGLDAGERFARFGLFRVLCALREGRHGVAGVNALAEKVLKARGLVRPHGPHYHGRPVLVTANDYTLGLFNGDIGMVLRDGDGELKCFFPAQGGGLRRISVSRLPEHETAYAMTVHKSQGSEFSRVVLVLPTREMPVLTRELVYTGVTRARDVLELMAAPEVFSAAVRKRTERVSGLGDLLAEVEKINEREDAAR